MFTLLKSIEFNEIEVWNARSQYCWEIFLASFIIQHRSYGCSRIKRPRLFTRLIVIVSNNLRLVQKAPILYLRRFSDANSHGLISKFKYESSQREHLCLASPRRMAIIRVRHYFDDTLIDFEIRLLMELCTMMRERNLRRTRKYR